MIIPHLSLSNDFKKHPLTWMLAFLNVFLFVLFFIEYKKTNYEILTSENLETTGRFYFQYVFNSDIEEKIKVDIEKQNFEFTSSNKIDNIPLWVFDLDPSNSYQMQTLGAYALRQSDFLEKSISYNFKADEILKEKWISQIRMYKKDFFNQLIFKFGLSSQSSSFLNWITYQFSHAGFFHLLSNVFFLVLVGAAVENLVGSFVLIVIYIFGGIFGGLLFMSLSSHGIVPVVGASASVSALLGFFMIYEKKANIRYFYFLSPIAGHWGWIYLPKLLIIPMFIFSDYAGVLSAPDGLASGVAYSAHIGGTAFGVVMAFFLKRIYFFKKPNEVYDIIHEHELDNFY